MAMPNPHRLTSSGSAPPILLLPPSLADPQRCVEAVLPRNAEVHPQASSLIDRHPNRVGIWFALRPVDVSAREDQRNRVPFHGGCLPYRAPFHLASRRPSRLRSFGVLFRIPRSLLPFSHLQLLIVTVLPRRTGSCRRRQLNPDLYVSPFAGGVDGTRRTTVIPRWRRNFFYDNSRNS